jgi:hypothetical protein
MVRKRQHNKTQGQGSRWPLARKVDTASYWGLQHLTAEGMSRYSSMVELLMPHATKYIST